MHLWVGMHISMLPCVNPLLEGESNAQLTPFFSQLFKENGSLRTGCWVPHPTPNEVGIPSWIRICGCNMVQLTFLFKRAFKACVIVFWFAVFNCVLDCSLIFVGTDFTGVLYNMK